MSEETETETKLLVDMTPEELEAACEHANNVLDDLEGNEEAEAETAAEDAQEQPTEDIEATAETATTTPETNMVEEAEAPKPVTLAGVPKIISTKYNEICKRMAERVRITKTWYEDRHLPSLNDSDDWAGFQKLWKEYSKQYRFASYSVNPDMKVLSVALANIQEAYPEIPVGEFIENAFGAVPRAAEEAREKQDREKDKADSSNGRPKEIEGQLSLFKDDGTVAEAASECSSRPLTDGEDVTAPCEDPLAKAVSVAFNSLTIELIEKVEASTCEDAAQLLHEHFANENILEALGDFADRAIEEILNSYLPKDMITDATTADTGLQDAQGSSDEDWEQPQRKDSEDQPTETQEEIKPAKTRARKSSKKK